MVNPCRPITRAGCASLQQGAKLLATHIVFAVVLLLWTVALCLVVLLIMKRTIGIRVSSEAEAVGLDASVHAGRSYTEFQTTVFRFKSNKGVEHQMELRVRAGDAAKLAMVRRCRLNTSG